MKTPIAIAVVAAISLSACQKAAETASQKAVEKTIEAQMKAGGAQDAKVELSTGSVKTTTVDKDGKTQTFEMGNASAVTEADVGLPFYPGAKVGRESGMKVTANDVSSAMVPLETTDPADKVADFYRAKLKAMSAGKQFMDMNQGDGHMLMLSDEAAGETIQVVVSAGKDGNPSTVMLQRQYKKRG